MSSRRAVHRPAAPAGTSTDAAAPPPAACRAAAETVTWSPCLHTDPQALQARSATEIRRLPVTLVCGTRQTRAVSGSDRRGTRSSEGGSGVGCPPDGSLQHAGSSTVGLLYPLVTVVPADTARPPHQRTGRRPTEGPRSPTPAAAAWPRGAVVRTAAWSAHQPPAARRGVSTTRQRQQAAAVSSSVPSSGQARWCCRPPSAVVWWCCRRKVVGRTGVVGG